ncbi:response regulator [Novosphingobium marinum]|uniref:DNA-binding NtrC family response regulator n=1 Tax=Novosphingobium marinum TaxID=1514948 RepID=A0A7Z0BXB7_9SPHN|nr:response regulator [Novosphingobium marinum]NYH97192.1 DNA-binding NtrC family response regulator [Novosphingobium marinum]GGC44383.1 response regulator [Novosphingobium marinum]
MPAKKVSVVEDEFLLALNLEQTLVQHGWHVMGPVGTVRDALALLQEELPVAAILDVNLGRETVTPVAVHLRERGVPFALASAYAKPEQYGGDILAGAPNAGKPTDTRRLLAILQQFVGPDLTSDRRDSRLQQHVDGTPSKPKAR